MLKDKMDKSYLDTSWNEMKEILDLEMPVKENRKPFFFWIYGLAGVLLLWSIGTYIYYEVQGSRIFDPTNNYTKEITTNHTSEKPSNEFVTENMDSKKQTNQPAQSSKNIPTYNTIQDSKTSYSKLSNFQPSEETPSPLIEQKEIDDYIDIQKSQKLIVLNPIASAPNESIPSAHNNDSKNSIIVRSPLPLISPLNTLFTSLTINRTLHVNNLSEQIRPVNRSTINRYEVALSSRIIDQASINGEITASFMFQSSKFWISPGIGLGIDNYDLSPGIDVISTRTLISKDVEPNRFAVAQEPPEFSTIETRNYDLDRRFYFSPQLSFGSKIVGPLRMAIGYQPRIFIESYLQDQDKIVQEGDSGLSGGQVNNVGFNELDLKADRIDHYLSTRINYLLSSNFSIGLVYLRQIDASIQLKPFAGDANLYDNILDKINRSELRLGLSYLF